MNRDKVLVTGHAGFVGSHLVHALIERGRTVFGTGSRDNKFIPGVDYLGRLSDVPKSKLEDISIIFHQGDDQDDNLHTDRNQMLRENLDEPSDFFCRAYDAGCRNFVYASTTDVYGNNPTPWSETTTPTCPCTEYAWSKYRFETFASKFAERNCNVIGLRYATCGKVNLVDGNWVCVQDIVRANLLSARRKFHRNWNDPNIIPHYVLNIAGGKTISINLARSVIGWQPQTRILS